MQGAFSCNHRTTPLRQHGGCSSRSAPAAARLRRARRSPRPSARGAGAAAPPAAALHPRRRRPAAATVAAAYDSYDGFDDGPATAEASYEDAYQAPDISKFVLKSGLVDFYELLGVDDDATPEEIKRAYRSTCKECHPDFLGDVGHNICILLNEAYEVLMDGTARAAYDSQLEAALADEADGYTGEPLSKWMPALKPRMAKNENPAEDRAVFVDENSCIGCKMCVWAAPATFRVEDDHGRSRAFAQWLNTEDELQRAIDSCPVSCIHWTTRAQLPALEFVMQNRVERVNVGIMMAGQGRVADVFAATEAFLKERRRKEEAAARKARRYSPAQEAARREAATSLLKQHLGWFAPMFSAAVQQMESTITGTGQDLKVGRRRRAEGTRWQDRTAPSTQAEILYPEDSGSEDYYLVPPERALVRVTASGRSYDA